MKKWVVYSSLFGMAGFGLFGCGGSGLSDAGGEPGRVQHGCVLLRGCRCEPGHSPDREYTDTADFRFQSIKSLCWRYKQQRKV